jgi:Fe2+ transport system protein FeoA
MEPLSALLPGTKATVVRIDIPIGQRGRLMEMGLLAGTSVELIRFAPLGDPVEIRLRGYHLSLRKHEAEQIWVQT